MLRNEHIAVHNSQTQVFAYSTTFQFLLKENGDDVANDYHYCQLQQNRKLVVVFFIRKTMYTYGYFGARSWYFLIHTLDTCFWHQSLCVCCMEGNSALGKAKLMILKTTPFGLSVSIVQNFTVNNERYCLKCEKLIPQAWCTWRHTGKLTLPTKSENHNPISPQGVAGQF